jgi:hypothetical protein
MTPGNHQFIVAKQIAQVNSLGYNQSCHMTAFFIEFQINDVPDILAGTDVDHIFLF